MRYRKLRIAWTVFCGIACALMIVLWIRSYWWMDSLTFKSPAWQSGMQMNSIQSTTEIGIRDYGFDDNLFTVMHERIISRSEIQDDFGKVLDTRWFHLLGGKGDILVIVPDWFLMLISIVFAAVPWLRWRFSVRSLLIAITLVAVVLGLIVWATSR
jgi:hypothetical protein